MIKITKAGWIYILITIVVGFAAVNTANNLIYILASALLSYMLISGVFGRKNILALNVDIIFPDESFARTPTPITIRITNRHKRLAAFLIQVHLPDQSVFFPFVPADSPTERTIEIIPPRRGPYVIEKVYISSVFPFNFFTRFKKVPESFETIIFPKPKRCSIPSIGARFHQRSGDQTLHVSGDDPELLSIRDYLPGDPIKRIHWKSTAKTGRVKTKVFAAASWQHTMIDFDRAPIADPEERISCVTFVIIQSFKAGKAVGLNIDGETLSPRHSIGHKRILLKKLACYGQE